MENLEVLLRASLELRDEKIFHSKKIRIGDDRRRRHTFSNTFYDNCILECNNYSELLRLENCEATTLVIECNALRRIDLFECKVENLIIRPGSEPMDCYMFLRGLTLSSTHIQKIEIILENHRNLEDDKIYLDLGTSVVVGECSIVNKNAHKFDIYIQCPNYKEAEDLLATNCLIDKLYLEGIKIIEQDIPARCLILNTLEIGPDCVYSEESEVIPEMCIDLKTSITYSSDLKRRIYNYLDRNLRFSSGVSSYSNIISKPLATLGGAIRFLDVILEKDIPFDNSMLESLYPFLSMKELTILCTIEKDSDRPLCQEFLNNYPLSRSDNQEFLTRLNSLIRGTSVSDSKSLYFNVKFERLGMRVAHNSRELVVYKLK